MMKDFEKKYQNLNKKRGYEHQMIKENILKWTKMVIVSTNGVKNLFE